MKKAKMCGIYFCSTVPVLIRAESFFSLTGYLNETFTVIAMFFIFQLYWRTTTKTTTIGGKGYGLSLISNLTVIVHHEMMNYVRKIQRKRQKSAARHEYLPLPAQLIAIWATS